MLHWPAKSNYTGCSRCSRLQGEFSGNVLFPAWPDGLGIYCAAGLQICPNKGVGAGASHTSSLAMCAAMAPSSSPRAVALAAAEVALGSVSICTPARGTNASTCTLAAASPTCGGYPYYQDTSKAAFVTPAPCVTLITTTSLTWLHGLQGIAMPEPTQG